MDGAAAALSASNRSAPMQRHTSISAFRTFAVLLSLIGLLSATSCQSPTGPGRGGTTNPVAVDLRDAPAPPGLTGVDLREHSGEALTRARLSLEEIVATLERPKYLPEDAAATAAEQAPAPLSLAAQRAYVAGRQAMHEGRAFEAIQYLSAADRLAPRQPQILRLLGQAYLRSGVRVRGAHYLAQVVALDREDVVSLFHLGRHAVEQGAWEEAIATFAYALERQEASTRNDPGVGAIMRFYLASALEHERYDKAALEQFHAFAVSDVPAVHSRFAGELRVLQRQVVPTWMAMGDAYCRLGEPAAALEAYQTAAQAGGATDPDLVRRLIYMQLRLNRPDDAAQTALGLTTPGDDVKPEVLELISYLHTNGVDTAAMLPRLREIYNSGKASARLTLAMATLMSDSQAYDFLVEHLQRAPNDQLVFEQALTMALGDGAGRDRLLRAAHLTQQVSQRVNAERAGVYAAALFKRVDDLHTLVVAIESADATTQASLRLIKAMATYRLGRIAEARQLYDAVLADAPDADQARLELATLLYHESDYTRVLEVLEPLAEANEPSVVILRARAMSQLDRSREAIALLNRSLSRLPNNADLAVERAELMLKVGDISGAERSLVQALNERPDAEVIYLKLAEIYKSDQLPDSDTKERWLHDKALRTIPHSRMARFVKVEQHLASRPPQLDAAVTLLRELVDEQPGDERAFGTLLGIYLATERTAEGNELVQTQLDRRPDDLRLNELASYFYAETGQYLPLARLLGRLLEQKQTKDAMAGVRRYMAAMRQAEAFDEADAFATKLVAVYPEHAADITYYRASLFMEHDPARCEAILIEALKHDPKHGPSNNDLGYTWADRGENLDKALEMIQLAMASEPNNPNYRDSLGWVYYKLGRFDEAVEELTRAMNDPRGGSPVIIEHLADALYRAGRHEEAVQVWRRTLSELNQLFNFEPSLREDRELQECADRVRQKLTDVAAKREPATAPVPSRDQ